MLSWVIFQTRKLGVEPFSCATVQDFPKLLSLFDVCGHLCVYLIFGTTIVFESQLAMSRISSRLGAYPS
jgi:hypothetical protein